MTARAPGHFNINLSTHLDLVEANRRQLLDAGLSEHNIHVVDDCTSCRHEYLWSHRAEGGFAGRMMGVIGLLS
jgi:copper oxidase (laccase) domain-containing protein